jgi:hypothetical protein
MVQPRPRHLPIQYNVCGHKQTATSLFARQKSTGFARQHATRERAGVYLIDN